MTVSHHVRVYTSEEDLPRKQQLAWKLAKVATDPVAVEPEVADMVVNRVIDNAAVAAASLGRAPVSAARQQALDHAVSVSGSGSTVFGCALARRTSPEWAAWANGVAVRELDYHDTFLAAEYSHPGDNIPPILAVAQHVGRDGAALVRGIATGYEIQIDLARAISLHKHKIDHVAHLGPSAAAGIGTMLGLETATVYQAIGQALHTTTATRQSRKGEISSWKAYAPAFAGKMAVEAVDRAMRGETSPSPIYEGEDGVIAWLLDGKDASYDVPLPAAGEPNVDPHSTCPHRDDRRRSCERWPLRDRGLESAQRVEAVRWYAGAVAFRVMDSVPARPWHRPRLSRVASSGSGRSRSQSTTGCRSDRREPRPQELRRPRTSVSTRGSSGST